MLKRVYRLGATTKPTFTHLLKSPYFTVKIGSNGLRYNRYGFVVTKRIDKRSSKRNRAKRVLRNCVEGVLTRVKTGYDLLFLVKRELLTASRESVCVSLTTLLQRSKLLR